jgi:hypothetical protein
LVHVWETDENGCRKNPQPVEFQGKILKNGG